MSDKSRKLYDAITNIDDDIIEAALKAKPQKGKVVKFNFAKAARIGGIIAASMLVAIVGIVGIRNLSLKKSDSAGGSWNSIASFTATTNDAAVDSIVSENADYEAEYSETCSSTGDSDSSLGHKGDYEGESDGTLVINYDLEILDMEEGMLYGILEGKLVPEEVRAGFHTEDGYKEIAYADADIVDLYIRYLREVTLTKTIREKDKFIYCADADTKLVFVLRDGTEVEISYDGGKYVTLEDVQYVFDFSYIDIINKEMCD